jgi:hypothetical protein
MLLCLGVIAGVAFAQYRNGLFTATVMMLEVLIAGIIAFNFWEPVALVIEPYLAEFNQLAGFEDAIALTAIFCLTLLGLRSLTNRINKAMIDFPPVVQQIGGPAMGLITGYLVAGFLVCMLETMPLEVKFLGFESRKTDEPGFRSFFPPDRVWLALMRHAGAYAFSWNDSPTPNAESTYDRSETFDRTGTFELRYLRYRRLGPNSQPMLKYDGELDDFMPKKQQPLSS